FLTFMAVMDVGWYFILQRKLAQAVSSAAVSAFTNRGAVSFSNIPAYIQAQSGLSSASVSVVCNGASATACTNSSRTGACLSTGGVYTATSAVGTTCSGSSYSTGAVSGYYLTITATASFKAIILPGRFFDGSTISRTATIRLQ
ncbi:MAG TPA: hypothetical protein VFF94_15530, partial [Novosphingobium sp.]|nr:hypothetical protein [Novosphingobium sp.]